MLVVFALNTIVGFACSIGIDMGFNSKHNHNNKAAEAVVHLHKDGKKHVHNDNSHNHDQANSHHKSGSDKDNCCNDKVTKFAQLDKCVPKSLNVIHPIFFTALVSTFYNINIPLFSQSSRNIKYFVRSHHPPIPDIRIAIQSFQI